MIFFSTVVRFSRTTRQYSFFREQDTVNDEQKLLRCCNDEQPLFLIYSYYFQSATFCNGFICSSFRCFFTLSNSCFDLAVNQNRIYIQSMIVLFLIKSVKQSKSPVLMTGPVLIIHDLQIKHIPGLPVYALR